MRKILVLIVTVLLAIALLVSPAAAGHIGYSGVTFSIGSLDAKGTLAGLGNTNVYTNIQGTGVPIYACQSPGGGTFPPGQNPPQMSSSGPSNLVPASITKNGKAPFSNYTNEPTGWNTLTATQIGCPNPNWTAVPLYFSWTNATINATSDSAGTNVLASQGYVCSGQTPANPKNISCTPQ